MSLLDGPHTVIVIPKVKHRNAYGSYTLTDGDPITVERVNVHPFGAGTYGTLEGSNDDAQFNDQLTIKGRNPAVWPGGVRSTIEFDGEIYDQVGQAKYFQRGSRRTNHWLVRMKARGAEVK